MVARNGRTIATGRGIARKPVAGIPAGVFPRLGGMALTSGAALLGLAAVAFLIIAWQFRNFTLDDPFITFRYARNLLRGHGPVYNPGEPIEGISNPLWMLLMAGLMALVGTEAGAIIGAAKIVGVLCGLLAGWGTWRLANLIAPSGSGLAGGAAALILALTVYFPAWSVGGLETPLFAAALIWLAVFLAEESGSPGPRWRSAALGACCATIRPEGLILAAIAGAAGLYDVVRRRARPGALALAALPFVAIALLMLARRLYYGAWLPNTYYAKSSQGRAVSLDAGAEYLRAWFYGPGAILAAAALVGLAAHRGRLRRHAAGGVTLALAALLLAVTYWEGGDWMPGFRFLVPILPLLAALAGAGVARVARDPRPLARLAVAAVGALLVAAPWSALQDLERRVPWAGPGHGGSLAPAGYVALGRWARAQIPPGSTIAIGEAGIIPYVSEHRYLDIFGLNDATIARMPGRWQDKTPTRYILGRDPEYIVLAGDRSSPPPARFAYHYANALFGDDEFRANYREVHVAGGFAVFCRVAGERCRAPLLNPTATGPGGGGVSGATLAANPPAFALPAGQLGTATITWATPDGAPGQVYVAQDDEREVLFAAGARGEMAAPWIQAPHRYTFRLYAGTDRREVLATITVVASEAAR